MSEIRGVNDGSPRGQKMKKAKAVNAEWGVDRFTTLAW